MSVLLGYESEEKTRVCIFCDKEKNIDQFHRDHQNRGGYDTRCKPCKKAMDKQVDFLKKQYSEYKTDTCECCGVKESPTNWITLDHCHETNSFRGWICNRCNLGIGRLGDNLSGVMNAVNYLKRSELNESR